MRSSTPWTPSSIKGTCTYGKNSLALEFEGVAKRLKSRGKHRELEGVGTIGD